MDQHDRDWLLSKGIPLSEVFDASGMALKEYKAVMRRQDKYVAINVTPCKRAGHRIRTRHGNCMACDVTQYAFSKRHRLAGHVYLAASQSSGLLKVGMATNLENRLSNLNQRLYGGAKDWQFIASLAVDNAGKVEAEVHSELKDYQAEGSYFDGDHQQRCFELFSCPLDTAVDTFKHLGTLHDLRLHVDFEAIEFNPDAGRLPAANDDGVGGLGRKKSDDVVFQTEVLPNTQPDEIVKDKAGTVVELGGVSKVDGNSPPVSLAQEASQTEQLERTTSKNRTGTRLAFFVLALGLLVGGYFFLTRA